MPDPRGSGSLESGTRGPGRYGEIGYLVVRNDRGGLDDSWYVVAGTAMYPDYARPAANVRSHGHFLTPDQADAMADQLKACASWARAQCILEAIR